MVQALSEMIVDEMSLGEVRVNKPCRLRHSSVWPQLWDPSLHSSTSTQAPLCSRYPVEQPS